MGRVMLAWWWRSLQMAENDSLSRISYQSLVVEDSVRGLARPVSDDPGPDGRDVDARLQAVCEEAAGLVRQHLAGVRLSDLLGADGGGRRDGSRVGGLRRPGSHAGVSAWQGQDKRAEA